MAQQKKGGGRGRAKADDDTGVSPVSRDGEGDGEGLSQEAKDELAAQRAKREGGNGGGSVAARGEQAALDTGDEKPPEDEEDDGQFFVWEKGTKVTLGTLIRRGTPVEHAFVFGGKRVKGRGGLVGFDSSMFSITRFLPGPVRIVPTRDSDENVTKVVVENHVDAKVVSNADSEDGLAMIAHILEKHGYVKKDAAA